jgi:hypothetical protein
MNPMLAEISDKMLTAGALWWWMLILSIPTLLGVIHRRLSWIILFVALSFSGCLGYAALHQAFLESEFTGAVQKEMGPIWIAQSIASAFLPTTVAFCVLCWHMRNKPQLRLAPSADAGLGHRIRL